MRLRTILAAAAAPAAVTAALLATTAGPAAAQTVQLTAYHQPRAFAYGQVELGSPLQDARFVALPHGPGHGFIDYTNWTYAEPGSGVWAPVNQPDALTFKFQGTPYAHTLNGNLQLVALSPERLAFSGTGQYPVSGPAADAWSIQGTIHNGHVHAVITYTTGNPGYVVTMDGTIANDGSASGTAESSQSQALTWTLPAGSFQSVLHYVAPVSSAKVLPHRNAVFSFTIPSSVPGLAGTPVTVQVHGGNHPTWSHEVTGGTPVSYPVEAGFIQVAR